MKYFNVPNGFVGHTHGADEVLLNCEVKKIVVCDAFCILLRTHLSM